MKSLPKVLPLIILAVLGGIGYVILSNPPQINRGGPPGGPRTVVETLPVQAQDYQVTVDSYGTVAPRTQSMLVSQVGGQIIEVQPNFRPGGFFTAGQTLLRIDPRDYEADVKIAEANLFDAQQALAQEQARAEQALVDWQQLGDAGETPSDLVLRKPQLEAARARVLSARSALTKAELDLERTRITVPFDGRVLQQLADLGQVVNTGAQLAQVYATDYVEVRLPIRNKDLPFVDLPEGPDAQSLAVTLASELGGEQTWSGRVVRTEGAIDETARQLHVVAQIDEPFDSSDSARPIKIGEYVTAQISGRLLRRAIVIPSSAIYQNSYVYVVNEGLLERREVETLWSNGMQTIIGNGLASGESLIITPLGQMTSGTPVQVAGTPRTQVRVSASRDEAGITAPGAAQ